MTEHVKETHQANSQSPHSELLPIRFGDFLLERELINDEQLLDALGAHWAMAAEKPLGEVIANRGYLAPEEIERQLAQYHDLDVVEI